MFTLLVCFHHPSFTTGKAEKSLTQLWIPNSLTKRVVICDALNPLLLVSAQGAVAMDVWYISFLVHPKVLTWINTVISACLLHIGFANPSLKVGLQNKLCLEIVMLSWSLKVWVIFKSMNLLIRILTNWDWAQAQAGVTAAAKKHQKIHDQPVPFSNFMTCAPAPKQWGCCTFTFGALATHSVKETEPWLFLKEENYLSRACSFYWTFKETEQELICVSAPLFLFLFKSKGSL